MPSQGFYILMYVVDVNDFVVLMDFKLSLPPLSYPAVSPLYHRCNPGRSHARDLRSKSSCCGNLHAEKSVMLAS